MALATPLQPVNSLLSLPAEIRAEIFTHVLKGTRCRKPVMLWDDVCITSPPQGPAIATAILQACWTAYEDCISILHGSTKIELSVRHDLNGLGISQCSLGSIESCTLLPKLHHVDLEISFRGLPADCERQERTVDRLQRLAAVLSRSEKLRTIDLVFFDQGGVVGPQALSTEEADAVLDAAMQLPGEKIVAISRNPVASKSMSRVKWIQLFAKARLPMEEDMEEFREISFDYWEHAFRLKN